MFKNLRLAAKIGVGFGLLIIIAVVLGGLAVYSMNDVGTQSQMLAEEYVPEVIVANALERASARVMYEMRGYAFSMSPAFYDSAIESLAVVKTELENAKTLADNSTHLVKLREAVDGVRGQVDVYEQLSLETKTDVDHMLAARADADEAAGNYMRNCNDFLAGQNERMVQEIAEDAESTALAERLQKITLVNEIIDAGNAVRVANFRSQAMNDPAIAQTALDDFSAVTGLFEELRKITRIEADLQRIDDTETQADAYRQAVATLVESMVAMNTLNQQRTVTGDQVLAGAQETALAGVTQTDQIAQAANASLTQASMIMLIGLGAAVVVGIVLAVFITLSITKPINGVIATLTEGATQVGAAAEQVSGSSQSMAEGTSEQASSLEETSASLEEMSSMTKQNASNANEANSMASEARTAAQQGTNAMAKMKDAISRIKSSSDETAKIIKTIDEIAFQTNLLALNAAVEAARAGDAGKGFAVVAEEVRNLAQRSAEAARSTSSLIEGSQQNADNGVAVSEEVANILGTISERIDKVAGLINEVNAASGEQAQGIDQINTAMAQMDQVTQANAANSEEAASASEELSAQARELNDMVGLLRAIVGGAKSAQANGAVSMHAAARPAVRRQPAALAHAPAAKSHNGHRAVPVKKASLATAGARKAQEVLPLDDDDLADF
jgi:methyl-accepting chemotaxis protein